MSGYIGSKTSVTLVDGYTQAEADAEFVQDPNGAITVSGGNVGINGSPSPSDGVFRLIQIGGANKYATFGAQANGGFAALMGSNFYYNGGWKRTDAGRVTKIETGPDSSSEELFSFQYAGDGAADSAISWSEAMRIDSSGNLLVGTTTSTGARLQTTAATEVADFKNTSGTGNVRFRNSVNSTIGYIQWSGSSTSYVTSSDYRLKTDAQPMTGASARVQALKPVNFEWLSDGTRVDGFLAHEAQEVVPEAVHGTKDAMRDEEYEVTSAVLDDDGNETTAAVMGTRSVPDYQGIDQSKLVPLLTAALQEALTKIDDMETRLAALEGN